MDVHELHDKIVELLGEKNIKALKELLANVNPIDVAEALEGLDEREILITFRMLPKESAADLFVAADPEFQEVLVKGFFRCRASRSWTRSTSTTRRTSLKKCRDSRRAHLKKTQTRETRKALNSCPLPRGQRGQHHDARIRQFFTHDDVSSRRYERIRKEGVDKENDLHLLRHRKPQARRRCFGKIASRRR